MVLYSVASTVGVTTTQRAGETGTLRTIGATPRQIRRLVCGETLVVTLVATFAGVVGAGIGGRLLFNALRDGGVLSADGEAGAGFVALAATAVVVLATSQIAASIAATRATHGPATLVVRGADAEPQRMHWWRAAVGPVLVIGGVGSGITTVAVMGNTGDPYDAMSTAGSASILVGIGLAVMAPWLLARFARPARRALGRYPSGYLAAFNSTRRAHMLSGVLAPVIVLVATAVGTLLMVGVDHRTMTDSSQARSGEVVNMLNYIVTGMISLFAAIMVVNAFAAVIAHRRNELQQLRLIGATGRQVRTSVVVEAVIVAVVGVLLGTLASTATILPFSAVRGEGIVPDGDLWLPAAIAAVVVVLTTASARVAAGRVMRAVNA
ncbi:MAG: FtsX-like permease family protein [Mycobacteriaceae bacterium]|uniref:FtsX-like permease family protein n=1 Tax=Corynebacterium sp. TaxID=1720 RepID=UPI003F9992B2